MARFGLAGHGKARVVWVKPRYGEVRLGTLWRGKARSGRVRCGSAWQGKAWMGEVAAWFGKVWLGRVR